MQIELEKALTKAETLDETLSAVMDVTSDTIFSAEGLSEESLREVEAAMSGEAVHETGAGVRAAADDEVGERITQGLRRIEEEMKKELQ